MKYNQPYGVSDPNAAYINGNPATGTMGSIPPAASIEYPQREISNLILGANIVPSNVDLNQLAKAIQSGQLYYGLDTGSANHMVTALVPHPDALVRGMFVMVYAAATNTGASDLTTNGISTGVVRPDGSALIPGDIKQNGMTLLVYDGTHWQLPSAGGLSSLKMLTQPLDLYVNGGIGNDANDGTANTAANAFRTVQHAVNVAQSYMPSQYGVNIHIADGVYNECVNTSSVATPTINIIGNPTTPDNVQIGFNGALTNYAAQINALGVQGPNTMNVNGVYVRSCTFAGGDNPSAFCSTDGSVMNVQNTSSGYAQGSIFEAWSGSINFIGNHKFNAFTGNWLMSAWLGGSIYLPFSPVVTLNIQPGCNLSSTLFATDGGSIFFQSHVTVWTGSTPTGPRYACAMNGTVNTQGGGASYIPGSTVGTLSTGGQYS